MTLTLPFPPTGNTYWKLWHGRLVPSPEADAYKKTVFALAMKQGCRVPIVGPVSVTVALFRKWRRGDLDNSLKVLFDSLEGLAYENDSQIRELHAYLSEDPIHPRVVFTVTKAEVGR